MNCKNCGHKIRKNTSLVFAELYKENNPSYLHWGRYGTALKCYIVGNECSCCKPEEQLEIRKKRRKNK
jgi:hypothetical protein